MSATPDDRRESGAFSFAMGEFTASFPTDRLYVTNHTWAVRQTESRWRFGLTAYAVRLLQDVYFLEWSIDPPIHIGRRSLIGSIESKKAESDLYSPIAGHFVAINEEVLTDPALINSDTYHQGWLFEMENQDVQDPQELGLLEALEYEAHLTEAWEIAQRTIKGQTNT